MTLNMDAEYVLDGGLVDLTHIDLWAADEGFRAEVDGRVDMLNWPESTYNVRTMAIDLPAMKEIFFARDNFTVTGAGLFEGVWRLFEGGRELTGSFSSADATLAGLRFPELEGDLVWTRDRFEITEARSGFYGGGLDFTYSMQPLGAPEPGVATFDPRVRSANLEPLLDDLDVRGARPRGRLAGELSLSWPLGRFAERSGSGDVSVAPARGVELLSRDAAPEPRAGWLHGEQPFEPARVPWRFPFGGRMRFTFEEDGVDIAPSWFATPLTAMSFQGRTAWGEELADTVRRAQRGLAGERSRHGRRHDRVRPSDRGAHPGGARDDDRRDAGSADRAAHRGGFRGRRDSGLERRLGPGRG